MCITVCVMAVTNGMVKFSSKHCLGAAVGDSPPETSQFVHDQDQTNDEYDHDHICTR